MEICNHDKVYSMVGTSNRAGSYTPWICKKCGEEGIDFTPYQDEFSEIKRKFSK